MIESRKSEVPQLHWLGQRILLFTYGEYKLCVAFFLWAAITRQRLLILVFRSGGLKISDAPLGQSSPGKRITLAREMQATRRNGHSLSYLSCACLVVSWNRISHYVHSSLNMQNEKHLFSGYFKYINNRRSFNYVYFNMYPEITGRKM